MTEQTTEPAGESKLATVGIFLFVGLCGLPALELTGFGFGIPLTLATAMLCAFIGGGIGGIMLCPKPWLAGFLGGIVAGPLGLLAVYYYSGFRDELWTVELVIVQGIASLPGVGVATLIRKIMAADEQEPVQTWDEAET